MTYLTFEGLTPLTFGTGKQVQAGVSGALDAETRPMPLPTTLAGAIRNEIARVMQWSEYRDDRRDALLGIRFRGPILDIDGGLAFESPADCVPVAGPEATVRRGSVRPCRSGGAWLPDGMRPTRLSKDAGEPAKGGGAAFWDLDTTAAWLAEPMAKVWAEAANGLSSVPVETRLHVSIDPKTRANRRGNFFATQGVSLGLRLEAANADKDSQLVNAGLGVRSVREVAASTLRLACGYEATGELGQASFDVLSIGGFRGLAAARRQESAGWTCPDAVRKALAGAKRVRLQLATPGSFAAGWRPSLAVLESKGLKLELAAACVGRRQSGSGWLTHGHKNGGSLRANRWLAPAGSVYFYEVREGDASALADLWLQSVADGEQDRRDGFGLALWGVWNDWEDA